MGHFVMFLFGVHPYQPTLDLTFFMLEWTIVVASRKKSFPTTGGGHKFYQ